MASDMYYNTSSEFANTLDDAFQQPASPPKSRLPIRETVTYPKFPVTADNNSCLDRFRPFEHVLSCGHLVNTARADQQCAPNCHHVVDNDRKGDHSFIQVTAMTVKGGIWISKKSFYCDACVESENEEKLPKYMPAAQAEKARTIFRAKEAEKRGRNADFRRCYIAMKFTQVPCLEDRSILSRYVPTEGNERHPLDTALPRMGWNMYEDVDVSPEEEQEDEENEEDEIQFVVMSDDDHDGPIRPIRRAPRQKRAFSPEPVTSLPRSILPARRPQPTPPHRPVLVAAPGRAMNQLLRIIPGVNGGRPTILPTENQEKAIQERHAAVITHARQMVEEMRKLRETNPLPLHNFPNPYGRKRAKDENDAQPEDLKTFEPYPHAKKRRMDAEAMPPPPPPKRSKPAAKGVAQNSNRTQPDDGEPRRVMNTPEKERRRREKIAEARSRLAVRAAAEEEVRIHQERFMSEGTEKDEEAELRYHEELRRRQAAARRRQGEFERDEKGRRRVESYFQR